MLDRPGAWIIESATFAGSLGLTIAVCIFAAPAALKSCLGLAGVIGALAGALLGLAQLLLARCGPLTRNLVWVASGSVAGLFVALQLGALDKIKGAHGPLAVATLVVGLSTGATLGALFAAVQPTAGGFARLVFGSATRRAAFAAVVVVASLVIGTFEATADWLQFYPVAQRALIGGCWAAMVISVLCVLGGRIRGRMTAVVARAVWPLVVALGVWRVVHLDSAGLAALTSSDQSLQLLKLAWYASDWDRDGTSAWFGGGDCAPRNPAIHPNAREVPGNGLDDNCSFGDARPSLRGRQQAHARGTGSSEVDVLLITIDAARADRTTPYGYVRDTTPNLAAFAQRAVRYDNAYTAGAWTCLALPALMSGVYPRRLTWKPMAVTVKNAVLPVPYQNHLAPGDEFQIMLTLPQELQRWTLQSALRQHGMRTIAVINPSGPMRSLVGLFGAGWDVTDFGAGLDDRDVTNKALEHLAAVGDRRFFLWVHYFDPHEPQTSHEGVPVFGDGLEDRYDHELASTDREIGKLLAGMNALGRRAVIVITADHGEAFGQGLQFHGTDLGGDLLRVPLLLRAPDVPARVVSTPASLVDIAPTVLHLTGAHLPSGLDGKNLLTLAGEREVLTDLFRIDRDGGVFLDAIAVSASEYRLTYDRLKQRRALMAARDLERRPRELDLARTPARLSNALGSYLEGIVGGPGL